MLRNKCYYEFLRSKLDFRHTSSRQCRDARVYGHTTTAMHDMSTSPPLPSTVCAFIAVGRRVQRVLPSSTRIVSCMHTLLGATRYLLVIVFIRKSLLAVFELTQLTLGVTRVNH